MICTNTVNDTQAVHGGQFRADKSKTVKDILPHAPESLCSIIKSLLSHNAHWWLLARLVCLTVVRLELGEGHQLHKGFCKSVMKTLSLQSGCCPFCRNGFCSNSRTFMKQVYLGISLRYHKLNITVYVNHDTVSKILCVFFPICTLYWFLWVIINKYRYESRLTESTLPFPNQLSLSSLRSKFCACVLFIFTLSQWFA